MKECPNCKDSCCSHWNNCPVCGQDVSKEKEIKCECGTELEELNKFCTNCGKLNQNFKKAD